jgi:hypothetical protein
VQVVRITVDLVRPVPMQPLAVSAAVTRPGKKVQIVEATMAAGQVEVARVRALRMRVTPVDVPSQPPRPPSPPPPDDLPPSRHLRPRTAFADALDLRFAAGTWEDLGPATMWSRLLVPVVAGETPTALQRVAAAADFGNGVSRVLDFETHVFINADLTVALARLPVSEWIGFDVVSRLSDNGFGQAESLIFDTTGPVGRAVQSLLVEPR